MLEPVSVFNIFPKRLLHASACAQYEKFDAIFAYIRQS